MTVSGTCLVATPPSRPVPRVVAACRMAVGFSCQETTDFGWCEVHKVGCVGRGTPFSRSCTAITGGTRGEHGERDRSQPQGRTPTTAGVAPRPSASPLMTAYRRGTHTPHPGMPSNRQQSLPPPQAGLADHEPYDAVRHNTATSGANLLALAPPPVSDAPSAKSASALSDLIQPVTRAHAEKKQKPAPTCMFATPPGEIVRSLPQGHTGVIHVPANSLIRN